MTTKMIDGRCECCECGKVRTPYRTSAGPDENGDVFDALCRACAVGTYLGAEHGILTYHDGDQFPWRLRSGPVETIFFGLPDTFTFSTRDAAVAYANQCGWEIRES